MKVGAAFAGRCGNSPRFWLQGIRCGSDLRSRFRVSGLCRRVKGRLIFLGGLRFISQRENTYVYIWLYSSFFINIRTCNGDKTSQNNRNDSPGSNTRNNHDNKKQNGYNSNSTHILPRSQESREVKKPRSEEGQKPRIREAKKLTSPSDSTHVTKKPRSQEAEKPRSREAEKPRSREAKKPRSREAKKPRSRQAGKPRSHQAGKPKS